MKLRPVNIADKPLETQRAEERAPAGHLERLLGGRDDGIRDDRLTDKDVAGGLIRYLELVVVRDSDRATDRHPGGGESVLHLAHEAGGITVVHPLRAPPA